VEIATAPPSETAEVRKVGGEPEARKFTTAPPASTEREEVPEVGRFSIPIGYELVGNGYCLSRDGIIPPLCGFKASNHAECVAECDHLAKGCIGYSFRPYDSRCDLFVNATSVWKPAPPGGALFRRDYCNSGSEANRVEILVGDRDSELFCVGKNPDGMGTTLVWDGEIGEHGTTAGPTLSPGTAAPSPSKTDAPVIRIQFDEPELATTSSPELATSPPELARSPAEEADVDCVVGEWSAFSKCDTRCGPGHRLRYRSLTQPSGNGSACPKSSDYQECTGELCDDEELATAPPRPVECAVGDWSSYSECSVSCGTGVATRSRKLKTPDVSEADCPPLTEKVPCKIAECGSTVPSDCGDSQECITTLKQAILDSKMKWKDWIPPGVEFVEALRLIRPNPPDNCAKCADHLWDCESRCEYPPGALSANVMLAQAHMLGELPMLAVVSDVEAPAEHQRVSNVPVVDHGTHEEAVFDEWRLLDSPKFMLHVQDTGDCVAVACDGVRNHGYPYLVQKFCDMDDEQQIFDKYGMANWNEGFSIALSHAADAKCQTLVEVDSFPWSADHTSF